MIIGNQPAAQVAHHAAHLFLELQGIGKIPRLQFGEEDVLRDFPLVVRPFDQILRPLQVGELLFHHAEALRRFGAFPVKAEQRVRICACRRLEFNPGFERLDLFRIGLILIEQRNDVAHATRRMADFPRQRLQGCVIRPFREQRLPVFLRFVPELFPFQPDGIQHALGHRRIGRGLQRLGLDAQFPGSQAEIAGAHIPPAIGKRRRNLPGVDRVFLELHRGRQRECRAFDFRLV